jgi:hypothetical protein
MIQKLAAVLLFCVSQIPVSNAYADDITVFGIPLGQDLSLPECAKASYGYRIGTNQTCVERLFEREKQTGPILTETVRIRFPIAESPAIVSGGVLIGRVIDGKLEGIGFNTMGTQNADTVLARLREKYGEPKVFQPRVVKNRLGASFDAFDAAWSGQNIEVRFQSVSGSLDSGLVNIDTKKGSDDRSKALKELTKDKRPL